MLWSNHWSVNLCILLPIIGMIDWGTQKLKYRKSTTESRLITGFMIGIALNLLNFTRQYYFLMLIIITIYFGALFLLMYLGYKREMKKMNKEMDRFSENDEII
jgi:Ca2+/Na+ antiporter